MSQSPHITEETIRNWADPRSFSHGKYYFQIDMIEHLRNEGMVLKGRCQGSSSYPYQIAMTLSPQGEIVSGSCSCPLGAGGYCKHAVALLLTWVHAPEIFQTSETRTDRLAARSKEGLIVLIEKMLDRYPELETFLEMPLPGALDALDAQGAADVATLDPGVIRGQMRQVMIHTPSSEWGASYAASGEMGRIATQGDDYAEAGEWQNAVIVYSVVAEEILDAYDYLLHEEEGEYLWVVSECVDDLARCLPHLTDEDQRTDLLQTLFKIYMWDINFGGSGSLDGVTLPLLEQTSAAEKKMVAGWTRERLAARSNESDSHSSLRALGGFLLQLEGGRLDDEAFLRLCRESGRTHALAARLLQLERVDEAVAAIAQAPDYELLALCDLLRNAGHQDAAEELLWKRVEQSGDNRLLQKLLDWVRERDESELALDLALLLYMRRRELSPYQQLREVARNAGRWDEVKAEVLAALLEEKRHTLLILIYLDEGDVDAALDTLRMVEEQPLRQLRFDIPPYLRIAIARAAEESRPQVAIDIYLSIAQRLIDERGRKNYAQAAQLIAPVRRILERQGQQAQWQVTIDRIRQENRNLSALRDELDKAGL